MTRNAFYDLYVRLLGSCVHYDVGCFDVILRVSIGVRYLNIELRGTNWGEGRTKEAEN